MRGLVPGLASPHPLGTALPAIYATDAFAQALTAGLDEVLAPIFAVLDNLDAYLDPDLTPLDFLDWLGRWVGAPTVEGWPVERRRAAVRLAVRLHRRRGTIRGLVDELALLTGGEVVIEDSGGVTWSRTPRPSLPGSPNPRVTVRIRVPDAAALDLTQVTAALAASKPAHVPHSLTVLST